MKFLIAKSSRSLHYFLLFIALVIWSCGGKSAKDDPILQEATKIHEEAHEMQEGIEPTIEGIDSLKTVLIEKKKSLADSSAKQIDELVGALDKIKGDFEAWEENVVSVPGMEDEHEHEHSKEGEHHHHHDHKPAPDVTSEQMLDIQKEIRKNIEAIKADLDKAMAKVTALVK